MGVRKTIYLPEAVDEYLSDSDVLSSRIAAILLRYREICQRDLPSLSRSQWCEICEANDEVDDLLIGDHPEQLAAILWANVADRCDVETKWGVDRNALVATMRGWSYAQAVAAYEAVRRFWRAPETQTDEALRLAGLPYTD